LAQVVVVNHKHHARLLGTLIYFQSAQVHLQKPLRHPCMKYSGLMNKKWGR